MNYKKVFIKFFAPIFMVFLCIASLAFPVCATKKSQTIKSTLLFQGEYKGKSRSYKYKNISFSATANAYINNKKINPNNPNFTDYSKNYYVSLYRKRNFLFSDYIGEKALSRYRNGKATWTNVGKGDYFFYFTKARDGVTIISNNVIIRSYQ